MEAAKRSDTYVNTSRGPSYGGGPGALRVSSNVVVKHEFSLRTEDGGEVPIQLTGYDIPIHDGNTVTMIAGEVPPEGGHWVRMMVHETGQWWNLEDNQLPHKWGLISGSRRLLILLGLIILGPILYVIGFISSGGFVQTFQYGYYHTTVNFDRGFAGGSHLE